MATTFSEQERKHHLTLLANPQTHKELFENAEGGGHGHTDVVAQCAELIF